MSSFLKQSTAVDIGIGPFLDSADGNTPETALTITAPDIRLKKNGGAFAQKNAAQTLAHEENGWYEVALDTTDTNTLGILLVAIHESGALPVWKEFMVLPANIYDSLVSGSDLIDANASTLAADSVTAAALAADAGTELATAVWALATRTLSGTQTFSNTGTWTGNLSGSVGSVLGAVGSVTGAVGSVTAIVTANMTQISGDSTAADNLETMLDGTGGHTLTLTSVVIANPAGVGLVVSGSTAGAQFDGVASGGLVVTGEYGLWASGVSAGVRFDSSAAGPGLECVGAVNSQGALFTGAGTGAGLKAVGGATGAGLETIGGGTSGVGIKATGVGSFSGIQAGGGITGSGLLALGGATSGPAIYAFAQGGNSEGILAEGDNTGADIFGDIDGNLSGSVGSVTAVGTGAITSISIAADAIGASELAASAVAEIVAGIGGVGAFAITVTVNDGAAALQNVAVSIADGGGAISGSGTTNASGQASFSLAAGTYTVALVKANYNFAPVSRTVTGNQAGSLVTALSMTIIAPIIASGTPGMCVLAGYIKDINGAVLVGSTVTARLKPSVDDRPITSAGVVVSLEVKQAVTNGLGYVSIELIRTDQIDQTCAYNISCEDADMHVKGLKLEAATKDIEDL